MAHLKTQETRHDAEERQMWKFRLIRRLYEQGYAKEDIIGLFRFIDWLMRLPEEAEMALWHEIQAYEEREKMDYITSVERIGMKRGFQQGVQEGIQQGKQLGLQEGKQLGLQEGKQLGERKGLLEGIELGLELKFGSEGLRLMPEIYQIEEVDMLRTVHEGLKVVETVEALRRLYRPEDAA
jgi:flagellar biosynthesis/type III secretory pathway protein FliH